MFKKLLNKKLVKNEKGLTLIELLAVIVILAIVAAIAIPSIGNIINKSKDRAILAEASNILAGAKIAYVDGACSGNTGDTVSCSGDVLKPYVDGIDVSDVTVTFAKTNEDWEITFKNLENIQLTEYSVGNPAKEKAINEKLKKAGGGPKTDTPPDGNKEN
ncbi:prepilin-type N-terminal cleavage/methylation domain-containing protein [Lysinibacillus sp. NPDC097195]|uniref:prepilin-type N-terminal cleavage/methylation domain-containing protein n=1 Tax=Lysinibacillus sp. NPDC097195 TaxID=3364141 RepID=UPI003830EEFD